MALLKWRSGRGAGPRRIMKKASEQGLSKPKAFRQFVAFWPGILSGVMALLGTLGILQYRWTSEASNADKIRIRTELDSLIMKWHNDLYSEFSGICTAIQVGPDSGARDTWNDYLERYVEWRNALHHESFPYVYRNPDLVRRIYIWETNTQTTPRLLLLNVNTKRIENSTVPSDLGRLLSRLQENSNSLSAALHVWKNHSSKASQDLGGDSPSTWEGNPAAGWQFDPDVPAIVHPLLHHTKDKSLSSSSPVDWIVITLDVGVLQNRIFPELAVRHFGGIDGLNYRIAVIKTGASSGAIYSSDPGFGEHQLLSADSSTRIFGPFMEAESTGLPRLSDTLQPTRSADSHNLVGLVWFPTIQHSAEPVSWVLVLEHRSGQLQAIVDRVKRNNLAISAAVLLLLAINIGVLALASYRAQRFAELQMGFVASVSHELRTPLSVIYSAGENIQDGVVHKDNLAHYGSMVLGHCRQLMNHVDRILLFASIRSGKDRYTIRSLEVVEILATVRKNLSVFVEDHSCVLEERIQPGLPPVMGDLEAVCCCIENLITNSVKYSTDNRDIIVGAKLQSREDGHREVTISVADHGIGIKKSELKQIFEPFYRGSDTATAQIQGTGLGLSLAKHVAEAMGGSLTVSSELGVGSVFTLHLQLAQEELCETGNIQVALS